MARSTWLTEIATYVRDQKKAKAFYTQKLGLKVRDQDPKWEYLVVAATKGGEDAGIGLWQPRPETFGDMYESSMKQIGAVTGIGFTTGNLAKTMERLKGRGVRIEKYGPDPSGLFAGIWDQDGNVLFVAQDAKPKDRRAGLLALDFVTVASRDAARTGKFLSGSLGMKGRKSPGESMTGYRLGGKGTAITPFTPAKEMYDDPKDYEDDVGHIGEATGIGFETDDIYSLQEKLLSRGVRFKEKAEKRPWGGISATFYDPDDNEYGVYELL